MESELSEPEVATDSQEEIHEVSCAPRTNWPKTPKTSKRVHKQKYNKLWEDDPLLKGWLSAVKTDPYKASCKTCWKEMVAELSELKKSMWFQRNISKTWALWRKHDPSHKRSHTVILWIRLSKQKSNGCFHCWTQFAIPDHPSDLVSNAFPNFKIALEFSSKQTKTCCIVKYVIAKRFCDDLEELLRHTKFSLFSDESTDIASKKQLAVVVCFCCDRELKVRSCFFKLLPLLQLSLIVLKRAEYLLIISLGMHLIRGWMW